MYKMYITSTEGYKDANLEFLTTKTTSEIRVSMENVHIGVKNISDLVLNIWYL